MRGMAHRGGGAGGGARLLAVRRARLHNGAPVGSQLRGPRAQPAAAGAKVVGEAAGEMATRVAGSLAGIKLVIILAGAAKRARRMSHLFRLSTCGARFGANHVRHDGCWLLYRGSSAL